MENDSCVKRLLHICAILFRISSVIHSKTIFMLNYNYQLRRYGLILSFFWGLLIPAFGQTFQYNIRLDEMDMLAENPAATPAQKITLLRDYNPHPSITGVAWKYPGTETPVAFVSGSAPKVTAKFELAGCTKTIWAKADGPGNFDLPAKQLNQGTYPATSLTSGFPANKVDFYEPFQMEWYISNSPNGPWQKAGKSSHPLYITHSPALAIPMLEPYHSVVYYGCKSGKLLTNKDQITDAIYAGVFTGKKVIRKDSPTRLNGMTYWSPINENPAPEAGDLCFTTEGLLQYEDGRCGAWSEFLLDMLAIQGISATGVGIFWKATKKLDAVDDIRRNNELSAFFGSDLPNLFETSPLSEYAFFFINNYNISNAVDFNIFDEEYDPVSLNPNFTTSPYTLTNGKVLNLGPQSGAGAQGNSNPQSPFADHAVVKYTYSNGSSKYFDPSYGTMFNTQNEWENASVKGFGSQGMIFTVLGFPTIGRRIMWTAEMNTATQQCIFTE